jgi:hypothetical protein
MLYPTELRVLRRANVVKATPISNAEAMFGGGGIGAGIGRNPSTKLVRGQTRAETWHADLIGVEAALFGAVTRMC